MRKSAVVVLLVSLVSLAAFSVIGQEEPLPAVTPKDGGTFRYYAWTEDPPTLDPYLNVSFRSQIFGAFFYSRLLMSKKGPGIPAQAYIMDGDLAETWKVSPDGKTFFPFRRILLSLTRVMPEMRCDADSCRPRSTCW